MKKIGSRIPDTKKAQKKIEVITFKRFATPEDNAKIPIVLTITTDEEGNIIKETGN